MDRSVQFGVVTLVQATAVSDRWGTAHYGGLTGLLSVPVTISAALAPWVGSALAAARGGYPAMFWAMAGVGLVAAAASRPTRLSTP